MLAEKATLFAGERPTHQRQQPDFEFLWREHRPRIQRLVARLVGDLDVAEDLTQEVCLRAFEGFPGFRNEAQLSTWLYRIAVNVVNRHQERRRVETVPLDAAGALHGDETSGPERAALAADLRPAIRAALERLPADLRATLVLQVYEGLRYREIAAVLEIPIGTVKSRLHNALQRLREELKDYAL